jgi:uncharacterized protein YsxB (DUF464 family)
MIIARYEKDGDLHNLSVNGHAGYAIKGQDIVCSGVSAIVYALIGWLENNEENAVFTSIDEGNGEVVITCEGNENTATAFYMAAIGIDNIANTYPAHVTIDIVGIAD